MTAAEPLGMIRRLPPAVADAIAAGEVVERPASVVKELCENAFDAAARHVEVVVEGGGTSRIRVTDDGRGMGPEDLLLAVARHATSKIAVASDLTEVATLGFRGEALASIAAIADVELTSRRATDAAARRLRVRASAVMDEGPAGAAPGTTVEVRDLFFATPARLRFLRSSRTEVTACTRVVAELAVCHPEVALTCRADGRVTLRSPGGTLHDACRAVFGPAAASELVEVAVLGPVAVGGRVSQPRAHRGTRGGVVLVVNGRRVHNRPLQVAVEEAYRGLLPAGRHPYGVVTIDVPLEMVDVNVHPAKREVRFREEGQVFAAVQRAVWATVQGAPTYTGSVAHAGRGRAELTLHDRAPGTWLAALAPASPSRAAGSPAESVAVLGLAGRPAERPAELPPSFEGEQSPGAGQTGGVAALAPLRVLGQAGGTWMVAASPRGVVLVDPHAAHEKVLYAELLTARREGRQGPGRGRSQLLLMPVLVECDPGDSGRLEEHPDIVRDLGFAIAAFGPATVRCTAVPAACGDADPARLVRDVLETLRDAGPAPGREHRMAALVACHSAVRFGDALDPAEQQRLLDRLCVTPGGMTCPHGRPTVVLLDEPALRRAFGRT